MLHILTIHFCLNLLYHPFVLNNLKTLLFYLGLQLSDSFLESLYVFMIIDLLSESSGMNNYLDIFYVIEYLDEILDKLDELIEEHVSSD